MIGGKSLGPRFLLPIIPLLAIVAFYSAWSYVQAARRSRAHLLIGSLGVGLMIASVVIQMYCMLPALRGRNAADGTALDAARRSPTRILVFDDGITPQLFADLYFERVLLRVERRVLDADLARRLWTASVRDVLVVSRSPNPQVKLRPFKKTASTQYGRIILERWQR